MTLWTNPTGENSIQAKWEIGKTAPANMISLWEQIQMWKWPPAEIRNGRRTCLVIQLGNCGIFRTLFCRICILRHGWGQFTITCHRCSAIFLQDQPLFSNFPLFEVLETQLTFKSVGEPDYSAVSRDTGWQPSCRPHQPHIAFLLQLSVASLFTLDTFDHRPARKRNFDQLPYHTYYCYCENTTLRKNWEYQW